MVVVAVKTGEPVSIPVLPGVPAKTNRALPALLPVLGTPADDGVEEVVRDMLWFGSRRVRTRD